MLPKDFYDIVFIKLWERAPLTDAININVKKYYIQVKELDEIKMKLMLIMKKLWK